MEESAQSYRHRLQDRLTVWSFKLELIASCVVMLASLLGRTPLPMANQLALIIIHGLLKWILRSHSESVTDAFEFGAQRALSMVFFSLLHYAGGGSLIAATMATLSVTCIGTMMCIWDGEDHSVEEGVVDKLKNTAGDGKKIN